MNVIGLRHSRNTVVALFAAVAVALTACGATEVQEPDAAATVVAPAESGSDLVEHAAGLLEPKAVHLAPGADHAQARLVVRTAQLLYTFWNTGDTAYLDKAVAPSFVDNTLPPGRPQGPSGAGVASAGFRAAVPDLTCELADLYVTGDTITARLVFRGHFTGVYNGIRGHGQVIDFGAVDIQLAGADGRIVEDWHLEDSLTFLQQAGLVTIASAR